MDCKQEIDVLIIGAGAAGVTAGGNFIPPACERFFWKPTSELVDEF